MNSEEKTWRIRATLRRNILEPICFHSMEIICNTNYEKGYYIQYSADIGTQYMKIIIQQRRDVNN